MIKKIVKVCLVLVLIGIIAYTIFNYWAGKQLEKELQEIKVSGGALRMEQLAPPPVPDEENAALIYQKAFILLGEGDFEAEEKNVLDRILADGGPAKWTEQDQVVLRNLFKKNEDVLRLIGEAATLKQCRFPVDYSSPLRVVSPNLLSDRRIIRLLAAKARLEIEEGNIVGALKTSWVGLRLAKAHITEPSMVTQIFQSVCLSLSLSTLKSVLNQDGGDIATCTDLLNELDTQQIHKAFVKSLEGERCFGIFFYDADASLPFKKHTVSTLSTSANDEVLLVFSRRMNQVYFLRTMTRFIDLAKLPVYEAKAKIHDLGKEIEELPFYCHGFTRMILKGLTSVYIVRDMANLEARMGAARLAVALKIHNLKKRSYPDLLHALVPEIILELPKDPFTGQDYVYRKEGEGFVVYSLGENLKDNGGVYDKENPDQGDIVWRCPEPEKPSLKEIESEFLKAAEREEQARKLYEDYLRLKDQNKKDEAEKIKDELLAKYPETKYAAMVKESPEPTPKPPLQASKTARLIDEGDKYYEQGKQHLEKTFRRGPDFDRENDLAIKDFTQAVKLYRQAQELDPNNIPLQEKIRNANQGLVTCRRQARRR